jgi:hypothetical protein
MSGPVATVLIRGPLSGPDRADLQGLIDAVSDHDLDKPPALNAFWVCDTRLIGGRYTGAGRPFAVETGSQPDWEPGQLAGMAEAFGFAPRDELAVVAFCGGDEDHRILGELCLRLAERFSGVVSFDGALWPPVPPEAGIDPDQADWLQVEPHFRRMIAGMPGRVVSLRYAPQPGREWVVHVGDVGFLRAWMEHPRFRMVK